MISPIRQLLLRWTTALLAGAALTAPGLTLAQTFPTKPVHVVIPFPPGAGPDLVIRSLSDELSIRWGQPIVVENRPGVGGMVAGNVVAKAPADGHTLLMAPNTLVISPHVLPRSATAGLDVLKDLAPVVSPAASPMLMLAHPSLGVKNIAELTALLRRTPGIAYGTAGNGSPMHVAGELFTHAAKVNMLHVPYRGAPPSVIATLAGDVKLLFAVFDNVRPHIQAGKLIPLAVAENKRTAFLPDLPTMAEQGVPGVEVNAWYGLFAPAATPPATIARINQDVNDVLKLQKIKDRFQEVGLDLTGGSISDFANKAKTDYDRYGEITKRFGIQAD